MRGYDGKQGEPISRFIRLHLTLDGRRFYHIPLLILDLGAHDMIIGRKWLAFFDTLVDCRRRCLVWPEKLPPSLSVAQEIIVRRQDLRPGPQIQSHQ